MRKQAIWATVWSGADALLRQGITFIISIVLARLLAPEEFGTYALLSLLIGISSVLAQGGFSAALIQKKDTTHTDECTVFWTVLLLSAILGCCFALLGSPMASFFRQPVLAPLSIIFGLNVFISALGSTQSTLLTRQLRFKAQMIVATVSAIVSGSVAIYGAMNGWRIWALAVQNLLGTLLGVCGIWAICPWRPSWKFSFDSLRVLWAFGGYMAAANLLDVSYSRLYTLLVGKLYGTADLGFYNRAINVQNLPAQSIGNLLLRAAFPIFSKAAHDTQLLKKGLRISVQGLILVNSPIMLGLSAVSETLIYTVYGENWLPAAPILQVLAFAGLLWPIHAVNINALMAQGHSKLFFRMEVIKKLIGIALTTSGALFLGLIGLAWCLVLESFIVFAMNTHYSSRFLKYGPLSQIRDMLPSVACAGTMATTVLFLRDVMPQDWPTPTVLCIQIISGAFIYLALLLVFRVAALRAALQVWKDR